MVIFLACSEPECFLLGKRMVNHRLVDKSEDSGSSDDDESDVRHPITH